MTVAEPQVHRQPPRRLPFEPRDAAVLGVALAAALLIAAAAAFANMSRLQPLVGLIVILSIAYALSSNRRAIDRRTVAWGLGLQILFALIVLCMLGGAALLLVGGT